MTAALVEAQAACRATDPDLFYPTSGVSDEGREQIRLDGAFCAACPVQPECLANVLTWESRLRNVGMVAGGEFFKAVRTKSKESPATRAARRFRARVWNPAVAHGTVGGYRQHGRLQTEPCDECRAAAALDSKTSRARLRAARRSQQAVS